MTAQDETIARIKERLNRGSSYSLDTDIAAIIADGEAAERQRVLVEERPAAVVGRDVGERARAKPEEDALLDPGVDAPAGRRGGLRRTPATPGLQGDGPSPGQCRCSHR